MIKLLRTKFFWINLLLGGLFFVLALYVTLQVINKFTRHGEKLEVPKVTGMRIDLAQRKLAENKMRWQIIDSVYMPEQPKMSVTEQDPAPGSAVKTDRIIYLVVNSRNAPMVKVPDLYGKSLKQAQLTLQGLGFTLGNITYVPDEAEGAVLKLSNLGKQVNAGEELEKGSLIDLEVGKKNWSDTIPPNPR